MFSNKRRIENAVCLNWGGVREKGGKGFLETAHEPEFHPPSEQENVPEIES